MVDASSAPKPSSMTYTCFAENSIGTHSKNITLNLIGNNSSAINTNKNDFAI